MPARGLSVWMLVGALAMAPGAEAAVRRAANPAAAPAARAPQPPHRLQKLFYPDLPVEARAVLRAYYLEEVGGPAGCKGLSLAEFGLAMGAILATDYNGDGVTDFILRSPCDAEDRGRLVASSPAGYRLAAAFAAAPAEVGGTPALVLAAPCAADAAAVCEYGRLWDEATGAWGEVQAIRPGAPTPATAGAAPVAVRPAALGASAGPLPPSPGQDRGVLQREAGLRDALMAPLVDLNLLQTEIPAAVGRALQAPYSTAGLTSCESVAAEIGRLDAALGGDLDIGPGPDRTTAEAFGAAVHAAGVSAVRDASEDVLPFRSVLRKVSGAERRARRVEAGVRAAGVRRGFLKGLGRQMGCAWPAAPRAEAADTAG